MRPKRCCKESGHCEEQRDAESDAAKTGAAREGSPRGIMVRMAARRAPGCFRQGQLEAQPNLELNHAPGQTRERVTKVIGIGEVGVALATGLERRQIQHVEDVEKIGAEV